MPCKLSRWRSFLDSLDTGGGHIIVLFVLLMVGWRMFQADATAGGSIMTLASGALLSLLKQTKSNQEQVGTDSPAPPAEKVTP